MEQNLKTVHLRNCPACGRQNGEWETRCQKCGRRLPLPGASGAAGNPAVILAGHVQAAPAVPQKQQAHRPPVPKPRPPAFPEHLRQELQMRVQQFRSRQPNPSLALPFVEPEFSGKVVAFPATPASRAIAAATSGDEAPNRQPSREPRASSEATSQTSQIGLAFPAGHPQEEIAWRVLAVAPLRLRMIGHCMDLAFLAGAFLAFLTPLPFLGVPLSRNPVLLGGIACGGVVLVVLYGLLFLVRSERTPGMRRAGLRLVNFDGSPAARRQRLWRLIGVVVSGGSFLLGFLWAALDEEKLYWHDHISRTFLTTDH